MSNQYTYQVPFTESELLHDYSVLRLSQAEIAHKYGTTQKVVWKAMKKMSVQSRIAAKRDQRGPKNDSWRGGRVLVAKTKRQRGERTSFGNGYYYLLMPEHPNADRRGYVAEHIVVATQAAGRALRKGEIVHHINLNKHDNRPENLVIAKRQPHAIWHVQLEEIAVAMLLEGAVEFSAEHGYRRI